MTWEVNGIMGDGDRPPAPVARYFGPCMVMGGAACVWEDIRAAFHLFDLDFVNHKDGSVPCAIFAINDIGAYFKPRLNHLCSYHEEQLNPTVALRWPNDCNLSHTFTHSNLNRPAKRARNGNSQYAWHFKQGAGGTSAMFASMVALALGYDRVILCGVPLDGSRHFFDPPDYSPGKMFDSRTQEIEWTRAIEYWIGGRVRSMSGRTMAWLGRPDRGWINDSNTTDNRQ